MKLRSTLAMLAIAASFSLTACGALDTAQLTLDLKFDAGGRPTLDIGLIAPLEAEAKPAAPAATARPAPEVTAGDAPAAASGTRRVTLSAAQAEIYAIVVEVALAHGIEPEAFAAMGWIESRFRADARNPSGASGVMQFMPPTARAYGLADAFDARANIEAAARLWTDNAAYLKRKLGRAPTAGESYLAHQQGAGGAARLLTAGSTPARQIVGRAAVVQNPTGGLDADATAAEFAAGWIAHFEKTHALFRD